ncbi:MAG: GDSL-type esterase/lipase family protein [Paracoccaceae bacterium]
MNRRLIGAIFGFVTMFAGGGIQAQEAPACPAAPMRLVVLGDSLADGLWASFQRTFLACDTMEVVRITAVSDGLAKSSGAEWIERYMTKAGVPEEGTTDVAVVQVGANDINFIRNGNSREIFNTEMWHELYAARVGEITEALAAHSAEVFWVGLPVVGNTSFEPSYQIISAVQKSAVRAAGGRFVDIHELTQFGTGDFTMSGKVDGQVVKMRAADKVHFTLPGYDMVARAVLGDLLDIINATNRRLALQDVQIQ